MTREEAKKFGLNLLHGIMERNESYPVYADNVRQAIEALSAGSSEKPNNHFEGLDEAASNAGFDYVDDIVLLAEPNHRWNDHDVEKAYGDGFKAGAEWDRNQMMQGAVEYEVWDFTSSLDACPCVNIPLDNKHYRSGDKVRVIVLPKGCEK